MLLDSLNIDHYNYDLPPDRIALFPLRNREGSKLLVYNNQIIRKDIFSNLSQYLDNNSICIANSSKVLPARLLFYNTTQAKIEIFCLHPHNKELTVALNQTKTVDWVCLIGNKKKWKQPILSLTVKDEHNDCTLDATIVDHILDTWIIRFSWTPATDSFSDIIHKVGKIPLPPYIAREPNETDATYYQTIYATQIGSVAAPTAGLHITQSVINSLNSKGINLDYVCLHVGMGTFMPVKQKHIINHTMHDEHFEITRALIKMVTENLTKKKIYAVGTTVTRVLESLYWIGLMIYNNPNIKPNEIHLDQWYAYKTEDILEPHESFSIILSWMDVHKLTSLEAQTAIFIVPGYRWKVINGLITNFHQPKSTLLLLIASLIGDCWTTVYQYALQHDFRFLSYGDASLLIRNDQ